MPQAWAYFRMLNEPEAVRRALRHEPKEDEDMQSLVQIAFYEGVHPRGFRLDFAALRPVQRHHDTEQSGIAPSAGRPAILHSSAGLALYAELRECLSAEIERHAARPPSPQPPKHRKCPSTHRRARLAVRRRLLSHRSLAPVQRLRMSMTTPCAERIWLVSCANTANILSGRFVTGDPPFEDQYRALGIYLAILAGDKVE